jgi:hypothetical protein
MESKIVKENHHIILMNKRLTITSSGDYSLDFHHRLAVTKPKNAILYQNGDRDHNEVIPFRRIHEKILAFDVDIYAQFDPLIAFAVIPSICVKKYLKQICSFSLSSFCL